jgi:hypothetical protein
MTDAAREAIIEIRDLELDARAIHQHVSEGVAWRRGVGAYGQTRLRSGPEPCVPQPRTTTS